MPKKNKFPPNDSSKLLESITAAEALTILRRLAESDAQMAKRIEDLAMAIVSEIDVDDLAAEVQMELESLCIEDVWDRSGSTSYGYVDPGDAACEMFEEALQPFHDQLDRYKQLSMDQEVKLFCMGMLKGIHDFCFESSGEYKDWAVDIPGEYFMMILDDWRKSANDRKQVAEMDTFTEKHCPKWSASRRKRGG